MYTVLGKGAVKTEWSKGLVGAERTFCSLPKSGLRGSWWRAVNEMAEGEVEAHMWMFSESLFRGD